MTGQHRLLVVALAALATAVIPGCGSGDDGPERAAPPPASEQRSAPRTDPTPPAPELELPGRVPRRARGPADAASVRVIRAWLAALNRGEVRRAARYFALPSKFQNGGTPVLTIDSERERIAINESLPCGGRAIKTGDGGAGFVIVTFRLRDRPGGDCGSGTGGTARGAIRIVAGRIREWYRLPDPPGDPQGAPPVEGQPV